MTSMNPMAKMPGFEAMQAQQQAFMKAITGGMTNWSAPAPEAKPDGGEDLDAIKQQLADLQDKLSKLK